MNKTILIVLVAVIIILGGIVYFSQLKNPLTIDSVNPTPSTADNSTAQPIIDNIDLKAGGSSYNDSKGVYSILYPSDYILDTNDKQHIRFYKKGATQKGQTEMYDGVIIVIETVELQGKTLSEWVDSYLKQATSDGTSEITKSKKSIQINKYSGYTYTLRGLGESTSYVLQKDARSKNAVVITTLVSDPQNVGFQTEVDKTLSTIEILK